MRITTLLLLAIFATPTQVEAAKLNMRAAGHKFAKTLNALEEANWPGADEHGPHHDGTNQRQQAYRDRLNERRAKALEIRRKRNVRSNNPMSWRVCKVNVQPRPFQAMRNYLQGRNGL